MYDVLDAFSSGGEELPARGAVTRHSALFVGQPHPREQGSGEQQRSVAQRKGPDETAPEASAPGKSLRASLPAAVPVPAPPLVQPEVLQAIQQAVQGMKRQVVAELMGSLAGEVSDLKQAHISLADRLTAIEDRQQHRDSPAEDLRANLEGVQVQLSRVEADLHDRIEQVDSNERASHMMVFGLPEQAAAGWANPKARMEWCQKGAVCQRIAARTADAGRLHGPGARGPD